MRSSDWSSDVCSSDLSFNGTVQVIGFIHDGRCNALKKLSYDAHGSTARNRKPTMPICRTADSTTAFGVALLSSMGRALVLHRLSHQTDLGHAHLLQFGQDLDHAAVMPLVVACHQHVPLGILTHEGADLALDRLGVPRSLLVARGLEGRRLGK